jgi:putative membrane protein
MNMKWMRMNMVAMLLAMFAVTACEDDDDEDVIDDNNWSQSDINFVDRANESNRAEIELSILAVSKGNAAVKAYGHMMADEHNEALEDLQVIANDQDFELSTALSAKHEQLKARLMGLSGFSFDTAYINSQVQAHNEAAVLFQNQSLNGEDQRLVNYANKYLPRIRVHLKHADSLKVVLNNSITGG